MNGVIYWDGKFIPLSEFSRMLFEETEKKKRSESGERKPPPR